MAVPANVTANRTHTIPDVASDDFVMRTAAQTITTKTIAAGSNTITGIGNAEVSTTLITGQTEDTTPESAADFVLTYDNSATSLKKVKLSNLPSGGGGDSVSVNGTAATDADFDDATPAAATGTTNVKWQKDSGTPNNISAAVDWGVVMNDIRRKPFYHTDCLQAIGGAGQWHVPWVTSTTSGTLAGVVGTAQHPGILRFISAAGANTGSMLILSTTSPFLLAGGETTEAVFNIDTLTNTTIRIGWFDSFTSTAPTDGAWIEIPSTGAAVLITKDNAGPTTSSTIATLSTATWYRARIAVNSNATSVAGTIWTDDGTQQGTQSNTTHIPTASGRETSHGVIAVSQSSVNIMQLDWLSLWWDTRTLTR